MCINHIGCACHRQQATNRPGIVKRMNLYAVQKSCQMNLPRSIPPHLRNNWVSCVKLPARLPCRGNESLSQVLVAVD